MKVKTVKSKAYKTKITLNNKEIEHLITMLNWPMGGLTSAMRLDRLSSAKCETIAETLETLRKKLEEGDND